MAGTIYDLYLKYANKVERSLESDRYFQYLLEIVRAGSNVLQQSSQVLHKVVDERWLTTVEESLDAINKIIEKPRRYVASREEIVPVELAKKITADSVRHLSMHTEFIASTPGSEEVHPTKILTVSHEDSYDLYENRFIYHLIQRLVTFIDKRTDVIFWATGDEMRNILKLESKIDDGYEQIEYKLEMAIKNTQSYAENDSDNMPVFMRIDRVRRLVMALRDSAFCSLMAGCARVRNPIQRTNLLMKDPDYRKCYQLWHFLESYDEVGYSIEVQESSMQFDEEYLLQMYTNLITNYTVFKSLIESDPRKWETLSQRHHKPIKPKFIKKIIEQPVEDRNIEDVVIRQVFVEEVTEAQLEAERQLAEQTARAEHAEAELEEMDQQAQNSMTQIMTLQHSLADAEDRAEIAEQTNETLTLQAEALQQALSESEEKEETLRAELEKMREDLKAAQEAQLQAEAHAEEALRQKNDAEALREREAAEREQAEQAKTLAEEARTAAEEQREAAERAAADAKEQAIAAQEAEKRAEELKAAAEEAQKQSLAAQMTAEEAKKNADKAAAAAEAEAKSQRSAREQAEMAAKKAQEEKAAAERSAAEALAAQRAAESEAESARSARQKAEQDRLAAQKDKERAEGAAAAAETARKAAEKARKQAEEERRDAEKAAETARQKESEARRSAEEEMTLRQEAENRAKLELDARVAAEKARDRAIAGNRILSIFSRKKQDGQE